MAQPLSVAVGSGDRRVGNVITFIGFVRGERQKPTTLSSFLKSTACSVAPNSRAAQSSMGRHRSRNCTQVYNGTSRMLRQ